jgi:hypothetical protein
MMETFYPSKRDWWLTALLFASAVSTALAGLAVWTEPGDLTHKSIVSGICIVTACFILDLLVRTNYTLGEEALKVRCGIFSWRVPITAIDSVRRSRTWISGPALSLDRLVITRNDSRLPVIISPIDQPRFLEDLAGRDARLTLVDEGIRRQPP